MEKTVIIINGKGGAGKDTLCEMAAGWYKVRNVSSITPIKEIALANGWDGEKSPKARKFLAELKELFTAFNDLPTKYLLEQYHEFISSSEELMFAHIREAKEIDKLKSQIPTSCITLLVRREGKEAWGNAADDLVEDYRYDYVFENNGTLAESQERFWAFLKEIIP